MKRTLCCSIALLLGAAPTLGCSSGDDGSDPSGPTDDAQVTWHSEVRPLIETKCQGCHQPGGIAPFSLVSYQEISEVRELVKSAVSSRAMPPWLADGECADYEHDLSLDDAQIEMLVDWVDAGAPEGEPSEAVNDVGEPPAGLSRVDLSLSMPEAYVPEKDPDDYRCFLIDWPEPSVSYVTGFGARPGNPQVVHHVIAFLIPPERAASYQALDEAEPGAGYTCFGGPGGGNDPDVGWIGAWAPGRQGADFPEGTGLEIQPGSKIALQVHYNTANGKQPDQTAVDVRLDSSVAKRAKWQFFADIQWLFAGGMPIPAGEADVQHAFEIDPTPFVFGGDPFVIHSVGLHMHTRGTSAALSLTRKDGSKECMLDIPRWDFHWQYNYDLAEPRVVSPGDKLGIGCHFDNSAANQPTVDGEQVPPKDLQWGEGTGDEMCLGALYVSEQ